jgi:hypothetical protein
MQRAGLNKSRVAVARIEAQMVHVYDFQLQLTLLIGFMSCLLGRLTGQENY